MARGKKKKTVKAKVVSNRKIAADHYVMELDCLYLGANFSPGQFVTVKVQDNATDPLLRIPLGVHALRKGGIKLLYKVVGPATEILRLKKKGEALNVLGPLGNGFDLSVVSREKAFRAILVAGGHGVAPLYSLAEALVKRKIKTDIFIGACETKHVVCAKEFKKLGIKVTTATEDGSRGCKGHVTDPLEKHLKKTADNGQSTAIFACGPRPMAAAVAKMAKKYQVPVQVSLDAYMACGTGACLGCAIETVEGYKLVCKDGPVFDARQIKWEKLC
ncbi:MAG: dihydroorotate dehydrogenase electron transfer subunit [Candidatus Omnitrophota bacterium]